jgi:hypothetical protein
MGDVKLMYMYTALVDREVHNSATCLKYRTAVYIKYDIKCAVAALQHSELTSAANFTVLKRIPYLSFFLNPLCFPVQGSDFWTCFRCINQFYVVQCFQIAVRNILLYLTV